LYLERDSLTDNEYASYFTVVDEVTTRTFVNYCAMRRRMPQYFRQIRSTAFKLRIYDELSSEEKTEVINTAFDTLWKYGLDLAPPITLIEERQYNRAADYFMSMIGCMIAKTIVHNALQPQISWKDLARVEDWMESAVVEQDIEDNRDA